MSTDVESVLEASFVLLEANLLESPEQKRGFVADSKAEVDFHPRVDIVASDLSSAIGGSDRFVFEQDRIELRLYPNDERNIVSRKFPSSVDDLHRLSEIVHLAIGNTEIGDQELGDTIAFGYNVQVVYSQDTHDSALQYIAESFFDPQLSERIGGEGVAGGTAQIYFRVGQRLWSARFEPRLSDPYAQNIYLAVNCHVGHPKERIPSTIDDVYAGFVDVWNRAHLLVDALDE